MKQDKLLLDLGTKATFFGLGLLASKKLRPYAKFFIVGGVAASALPGIMTAVEQIKAKRSEETVDEVVIEEAPPCCADETAECDQTEVAPEPSESEAETPEEEAEQQ